MRAVAFVGASCVVVAGACLPKDTRPPPGEIELTGLNAGAFTVDSPTLTTADGWTLTVSRFFVSIGNGQLDGSKCDFYSDARYRRILDLRRTETQRIGLLFALGQCDLGFAVRDPGNDDVLGAGVTAADETFMRTPVPDDYTATLNGGLGAGVSLFIEGNAKRDTTTKRFSWAFRRHFEYSQCSLPGSSGLVRGVDLKSAHTDRIDVMLHGESLFLDSLDTATAKPRFDAIAGADTIHGNADGEVTLHELSLVPLGEAYPGAASSAAQAGVDAGAWTTLEDFVYLGLAQRIARIAETGACDVAVNNGRQD